MPFVVVDVGNKQHVGIRHLVLHNPVQKIRKKTLVRTWSWKGYDVFDGELAVAVAVGEPNRQHHPSPLIFVPPMSGIGPRSCSDLESPTLQPISSLLRPPQSPCCSCAHRTMTVRF